MAVAIRIGKSERRVSISGVLGFLLGACALVAMVKTAIDTYQEGMQSKWPSVVATITNQSVVEAPSGRRKVWYILTELSYSVDGEPLASSIRSRVTYSTEERAAMREWASRHQPGTSLMVRYDPQHRDNVVPSMGSKSGSDSGPNAEKDTGDMPETGSQLLDDRNMFFIFFLSSISLIAISRVLQRRQG